VIRHLKTPVTLQAVNELGWHGRGATTDAPVNDPLLVAIGVGTSNAQRSIARWPSSFDKAPRGCVDRLMQHE